MSLKINEQNAPELLKIANCVVAQIAKEKRIPASDHDDYVQELLKLLLDYRDIWTPPDNVTLEAYTTKVMKHRVIDLWRKSKVQYNTLNHAEPLYNYCPTQTDTTNLRRYEEICTDCGVLLDAGETETRIRHAKMLSDIDDFIESLPPDERELCQLLKYHRISETCKILNKHRQTVLRMRKRIKTKMLEAGFSGGRPKKFIKTSNVV